MTYFAINLVFSEDHSEAIKNGIRSRAHRLIPISWQNDIDAEEIAEVLILVLEDKTGRIQMDFSVTGTPTDPVIALTSPSPIRIAEAVRDKITEKLRSRGRSVLEKSLGELLKIIK